MQMINSEVLDRERQQFFVQTRGGVYSLFTGMVFWSSLGAAGYMLSPQTLSLTVFLLVLSLLPVALIAGKRLTEKLLSKSPLASLILPSLIPALMSFGITIPLYSVDITLVPVAFVLGFSFHWPAVSWLYNHQGFIVHSLVRTFLAVSFWYFFPEHIFTLMPLSIGLLYLATALWMLVALDKAGARSGPSDG